MSHEPPASPLAKREGYPGLGQSLQYHDYSNLIVQQYPFGINGYTSDMLTVREVALLSIVDRLSDKPDWHLKVFNEEIVAKWRQEALAIPDSEFGRIASRGKEYWPFDSEAAAEGVMNAETFECCIQELREKAKYFEKTGIVPVLDATASVAKSDSLVPVDLRETFIQVFDRLEADQAHAPDWHPGSDETVLDLVHPSMYPLVYGRSRVIKEEVVGVEDAIWTWAGKGDIIPKPELPGSHTSSGHDLRWSTKYQWLPSNMKFNEDGVARFTSYINNLHPTKYANIYKGIEELVNVSIPMWDQCLSFKQNKALHAAGRTVARIPYEGTSDEEPGVWIPDKPSHDAEDIDWDQYDADVEEWGSVRKAVHPVLSHTSIDYAPKDGMRLRDLYKDTGLQVIVKMASIKLTPDKPEFSGGSWHVEGQMNERICGTALYYLDSENISSTQLEFRIETDTYDVSSLASQGSFYWLEKVYGTSLTEGLGLQNYGTVETRPGRLLAFPNVFQHSVSPFKLEDPTKPGHRRFIALWLVDPAARIISTANVPPQQLSWWAEAAFGASLKGLAHVPPDIASLLREKDVVAHPGAPETRPSTLPAELTEMVKKAFDNDKWLMHEDEAKEHRAGLMEVRTASREHNESEIATYSFCEH